jgi:TadE-like protein
MKNIRSFLADENGGPAAEFGMVLPLALIFLFGIIDVGRYMWDINQSEKATQTGARWAVATGILVEDLAEYSFTTDGGILQGELIDDTAFPGVNCNEDGCQCVSGGTCDFDDATLDDTSFAALIQRMSEIKPDIGSDNVVINYSWSGLGFAGDPNGPDVSPIVTISLTGMEFRPLLLQLFGGTVSLPNYSYSLTMEDGYGNFSN